VFLACIGQVLAGGIRGCSCFLGFVPEADNLRVQPFGLCAKFADLRPQGIDVRSQAIAFTPERLEVAQLSLQICDLRIKQTPPLQPRLEFNSNFFKSLLGPFEIFDSGLEIRDDSRKSFLLSFETCD
jgi:hypothetical protein